MKNRPYTGKDTFVHREPFMATGKTENYQSNN